LNWFQGLLEQVSRRLMLEWSEAPFVEILEMISVETAGILVSKTASKVNKLKKQGNRPVLYQLFSF
jgi:hypothetical protein